MKYFYFDAVSHVSVKSQDAIEGQVDEILDAWRSLSHKEGSFLGFYTSSGSVVQFRWSNLSSVLLDVPRRDLGGSMTKDATFEEVCVLIKRVCDGLQPDKIEGLEFSCWR